MNILSQRVWRNLASEYRAEFGLRPAQVDLSGRNLTCTRVDCPCNLPVLRQARRDALQQGLRWGEPYTFFLAPGLTSWIVPIMDGAKLLGGVQGQEIIPTESIDDSELPINYLVASGTTRKLAAAYIKKRPTLLQSEVPRVAWKLYGLLYQLSPYTPEVLTQHREDAQQQRQIAEAIHEQKESPDQAYPVHDERILLSQLRAGDRTGARGTLNRVLAAMFLYSPRLPLIRARAIEMLGYLVRAAIEDNPVHDPLMKKHQDWIEEILGAEAFEEVSRSMRRILDEFMDAIFLQGYNRSNLQVRKILEFISSHYTQQISLDDIGEATNLSRFYVARIVKQHTGKTVTQHLRTMRIERASHLLEHGSMSCSELTYELGFADQSYFTRQFREMMGTTPLQYRKTRQTRHLS
jgi:AraC-like DNA-binding protein